MKTFSAEKTARSLFNTNIKPMVMSKFNENMIQIDIVQKTEVYTVHVG